LNATHKGEKNLAIFIAAIDFTYNEIVYAMTCEFMQWNSSFRLSMDKPGKNDSFVNNFETCVSKLKEHRSKAVNDDALMRVLILYSVRATEFHPKKLEITSNLSLTRI